jgi:hypothetical protein
MLLINHVFVFCFKKNHISLYFYKCKILYKGSIDMTYSPDCTNCQLCLSIKTYYYYYFNNCNIILIILCKINDSISRYFTSVIYNIIMLLYLKKKNLMN